MLTVEREAEQSRYPPGSGIKPSKEKRKGTTQNETKSNRSNEQEGRCKAQRKDRDRTARGDNRNGQGSVRSS